MNPKLERYKVQRLNALRQERSRLIAAGRAPSSPRIKKLDNLIRRLEYTLGQYELVL